VKTSKAKRIPSAKLAAKTAATASAGRAQPTPGRFAAVMPASAISSAKRKAARASIHVEASGRDAHHVAEAAFKAVGRALRVAVAREGAGLPSTKGLL